MLLHEDEQLAFAGTERGATVFPIEHLEAHHAAVVVQRSLQVGDGQVHGSDGGEWGDLGAWRRRSGPELLRIRVRPSPKIYGTAQRLGWEPPRGDARRLVRPSVVGARERVRRRRPQLAEGAKELSAEQKRGAQDLPATPWATQLVRAVVIVVIANSVVSLVRVGRGTRWATTLIQFFSMLTINTAIVAVRSVLKGENAASFQLGPTLLPSSPDHPDHHALRPLPRDRKRSALHAHAGSALAARRRVML